MIERIPDPTKIRHWHGNMEVDHYLYTSGIAGERFFTALRDEGKILGAECKACNITYVPPRIYCERCFAALEDSFVDVGLKGRVRTFTVARIDKDGNELDEPEIRAIVMFGDNTTGLLHLLGEVEPEAVRIGMEVEAVLRDREEREGKITDIEYFKPV